jgi:hypothetical protein
VHIWNRHTIRSQPNRKHSIPGIPWMIFHYPGNDIRNYKVEFSQSKLEEISELFSDWNKEAYLPSGTLQWCHKVLEENGFTLPINHTKLTANGKAVHKLAYMQLRRELYAEIIGNKNLAGLGLLPKPTGAYQWQPSNQDVSVGLNEAFLGDSDREGVDFANEGADGAIQLEDDFPGVVSSDEEEVEMQDNDQGVPRPDLRGFVPGGYASSVESEDEEDLGSNIRRGWCTLRASARRMRR